MSQTLIISCEASRQRAGTFYPVPSYENYYEINRLGMVWGKARYVNSPICGGHRLVSAQRVKIGLTAGYPSFDASCRGKRRRLYLHRILGALFVPNPEKKPEINHRDGDKKNFSLSNLERCTHLENMQHAHRTGLIPPSKIGPGERCPAAKLNDEKVRDIKRRLRSGETETLIAKFYGVARGTVVFIAAGETWAHITAEDE